MNNDVSVVTPEDLRNRISAEATKFTEDRLCDLTRTASQETDVIFDKVDRYEMMKALSDGGLLLREGRLIKREDRTNPDRFAA